MTYDDETHMATIEQRNYFKKGDVVEIFGPNHETYTLKIGEIFDENGDKIDIVRHPKQIIKMYVEPQLYPFDLMRQSVVDNDVKKW